MKSLFFLFLFSWIFVGHSQTINEIKLTGMGVKDSLGVWTNGDYQVYVELGVLEEGFRLTGKNFESAGSYYQVTDSSTLLFYNHTAKRYLSVVDQLEHVNNGFHLNGLILYDGMENEKQNVGNSEIVKRQVMGLVKGGRAVVLYKGNRVDALKSSYESKGEAILGHGYEIRIYFDDPENCLFTEFQHLGW